MALVAGFRVRQHMHVGQLPVSVGLSVQRAIRAMQYDKQTGVRLFIFCLCSFDQESDNVRNLVLNSYGVTVDQNIFVSGL